MVDPDSNRPDVESGDREAEIYRCKNMFYPLNEALELTANHDGSCTFEKTCRRLVKPRGPGFLIQPNVSLSEPAAKIIFKTSSFDTAIPVNESRRYAIGERLQ